MIDFNAYKNGFFATRDNLDDALEYAAEVAAGSNDSAAVYTALHVVLNTFIAQQEKQAQQAPAAPAVQAVTLTPLVHDIIAQQVEQAIEAHADGVQEKIAELVQEWADENLQAQVATAVDEWMDENLNDRMQGEGLCDAIRDAFRHNLQISIQ